MLAFLTLPAAAQAAFPGQNGKIAFAMYRDGTYEIYSMNADGTSQTRLTNNTALDGTPAWSPDGTKIAFVTGRDGGYPYEIYAMNADGTDQARLTNDTADDGHPAWSPDGTKIALEKSINGGSPYQIYSMNADGTNPVRLTNNSYHDLDPAWSPDGTKIAFARQISDGSTEIYTINADGTNPTRLTNNTADDANPAWSPDGRKIAFAAGTTNGGGYPYQIYTINADGTNPTRLTNNTPRSDDDPAWSPDGTKIAFETNRDGNYEIYTMNADGSSQTRLTNDAAASNYWPDWQPIPYTGYPRPKGATPFQTYLVPAYRQCVAPTRLHGSPLSFPSCNPPLQASSYLTLGTPDANGQPAKSTGVVFMAVRPDNPPTSPADVVVVVSVTDVRNKSDLSDYAGRLQVNAVWRLTDKYNGPGLADPATMIDIPGPPVNVPCAATADTTVGSTCSVRTTVNAIVPGAVQPGRRAVVELGQVQVWDGGSDGNPSTTLDNTLFLTQGLFIP